MLKCYHGYRWLVGELVEEREEYDAPVKGNIFTVFKVRNFEKRT